jgi:hypothetical protein
MILKKEFLKNATVQRYRIYEVHERGGKTIDLDLVIPSAVLFINLGSKYVIKACISKEIVVYHK